MLRPWPASSPGIPGPQVASRDAGQDRPRWARLYRPRYPPRGRGYLGAYLGLRSSAESLCYMRETFVQLDRNRLSIRLSKQPKAEPRSAVVQRYLLSVEYAPAAQV